MLSLSVTKIRALLAVSAFLAVGFSVGVSHSHSSNDQVGLWDATSGSPPSSHRHPSVVTGNKYSSIRNRLDFSYHVAYSKERIALQDAIIDSLLLGDKKTDTKLANSRRNCHQQWIVFTAGAMGAGKSHTIKLLHQKGRFPLQSFTVVDPDQIRQRLPEFQTYVAQDPEHAGELTRKEAGMISEVLIEAALARGHNVLVDGSLRDAVWYRNFFLALRNSHPDLGIAIVHVTAPREAVFAHALSRAKTTGRVVPRALLESSLEQVPTSVALLRPMVNFSVDIHNSGTSDVDLVTPGLDWETFENQWKAVAACHG